MGRSVSLTLANVLLNILMKKSIIRIKTEIGYWEKKKQMHPGRTQEYQAKINELKKLCLKK